MTRRSGLGKGLSSLIPPADGGVDAAARATARCWSRSPSPTSSPNPHQPRVHFDEETLGRAGGVDRPARRAAAGARAAGRGRATS